MSNTTRIDIAIRISVIGLSVVIAALLYSRIQAQIEEESLNVEELRKKYKNVITREYRIFG